MRPQSMGAIVGGLENLGMAQRAPHPTDGADRETLFEAGRIIRRLVDTEHA